MQNYRTVTPDKNIKDSWYYFRDNERTIMSCHSGNNPPKLNNIDTDIDADTDSKDLENLYGVLYYNTAKKTLSQFIGVKSNGELDWRLIVDFANSNMEDVLVDRGAIASSFNFNTYKTKSAIYRVSVSDSNWSNTTSKPNTTCSNNGILMVAKSGSGVVQTYIDLEDTNGGVYTRTFDDSSWKNWSKNWTTRNLTKLSQLSNDKNFISGITSAMVSNALGYVPANQENMNMNGGSPTWKSSAPFVTPVVNNNGLMDIGRYIRFHPKSGSNDITVTLDAGTSGQTLSVYKTGTSTPANILCYGDVTAFSDERLKTDIEVIKDPIDKIKCIRGVTFRRNDMPKKSPRQTGLIAQDVQKVLPEAIRSVQKVGTSDEYLTIAYGNTVGLLVEAIKEQQLMIEKLAKACGVDLDVKPPVKKTAKKTIKKVTDKPVAKTTRTRKKVE